MGLETLIFYREDQRKRLQDEFFRPEAVAEPHPDPLSFLPEIYQPIYELENFDTELVAIFYNSPAPDTVDFHLIFRDEAINYSRTLDERYRELRQRKYGRTTDVESVRVRLVDVHPLLHFPFDYSLTPFYSGSLHYASRGVTWITGRIYTSSWNHLMDQLGRFSSPLIRLYGGYQKVEPSVIQEGTREDAEAFRI